MLISSSQYVNHAFMHPFLKEEIPFSWLCSWGRILIPATCNYMTWLNFIKYMHTYLISSFWSYIIPLENSLIEITSVTLTCFTYFDIIPSFHESHIRWNSWQDTCFFQKVNLSMKIPIKDLDYPHLVNAPFLTMYDELYTRWIYFKHKYYLCF